MSVHEDTLLGLNEALEFVKGDKTKARSTVVTIAEDETEIEQVIFQKIKKLSKPNKQRTMQYVDELLRASN